MLVNLVIMYPLGDIRTESFLRSMSAKLRRVYGRVNIDNVDGRWGVIIRNVTSEAADIIEVLLSAINYDGMQKKMVIKRTNEYWCKCGYWLEPLKNVVYDGKTRYDHYCPNCENLVEVEGFENQFTNRTK